MQPPTAATQRAQGPPAGFSDRSWTRTARRRSARVGRGEDFDQMGDDGRRAAAHCGTCREGAPESSSDPGPTGPDRRGGVPHPDRRAHPRVPRAGPVGSPGAQNAEWATGPRPTRAPIWVMPLRTRWTMMDAAPSRAADARQPLEPAIPSASSTPELAAGPVRSVRLPLPGRPGVGRPERLASPGRVRRRGRRTTAGMRVREFAGA